MAADRLTLAGAFARAAGNYWAGVFPIVSRELCRWRARAERIPDPFLRELALEGLSKRGNMEGAAAFATFAPRAHRGAVVRAAVAFQSAYNYLDTLSEQPSRVPLESSRRLHEALLVALASPPARALQGVPTGVPPAMGCLPEGDRDAPRLDYYEHHYPHRGRGDGGYLAALVDACRTALRELPSYPIAAPAALRAAERVVCFQALHTGDRRAEHEAMERWGRTQMEMPKGGTASERTPSGAGLRWWEAAASGGSSLGVHVMIAAAADPAIDSEHVQALEQAYFPWIGALHSMLDHLVDAAEDARRGQRNLIGLYASPEEAAERMSMLAERALACARTLPPAHRHELIVAAMASFYLADPAAHAGEAAPVTRAVLEAFGPLARPALAIFNARRAAERVYYAWRSHGHYDTAVETLALAASHR